MAPRHDDVNARGVQHRAPLVDRGNAILMVDNSVAGGIDHSTLGAIYKGLAIGNNGSGNFIYATNFSDGVVEMYDGSFNFVKSFTDPRLEPDAADVFATWWVREKAAADGTIGNDYKGDAMTAVPAEPCIECGHNPRAGNGRLSRCLVCIKVAAQRDREAREQRRAGASEAVTSNSAQALLGGKVS